MVSNNDIDRFRLKLYENILKFYAWPGNWAKPVGPLPRNSTALSDAGRFARAAMGAESVGMLICVSCDILNIALTELGRKCGIADPRMGEIARTEPNEHEFARLYGELSRLFAIKYSK
jgi:hypothetical protein